jgi:hypothetical protein
MDCGVSGVRGIEKGKGEGIAVPGEEYKIISVELSSISW